MDEDALVQRIREASRAGGIDSAAEAELCLRFGPRVRGYGLRHFKNAQLAADLVQEALLVLLGALRAGRIEDASRIPAFVMATCRNLTADALRTSRRRARLLEQLPETLAAAAAPPPAGADVARVRGCLEQLPDRDRAVLDMTFFEERAAQEIAATLSVTVGNLRVLRHRALLKLRACVEEVAA